MSRSLIAHEIAIQVFKEFEDRKGFKHLLEKIRLESPDVYSELFDTIWKIIENVLDKEDA